ncbi:MAG: hypothetical protein JW839_09135 [Candidatus Lokiarchaeota archaeon]|nr:hypothetical protein [Candidatus Lokiarchaeota archaeon]
MAAFRIVPVVDLKDGRAVHAVKGQREAYAPVNCGWCKDGDALSLVEGYKGLFGLRDVYVADLDAITGRKPNTGTIRQIRARVEGEVMVDAGIASIEEFNDIASEGIVRPIVGTESVPSMTALAEIVAQSGHSAIVSLDVKGGAVVSPARELSGAGIHDAYRTIEGLWPAAVIFLDMSAVGARTGINPTAMELAREARLPLYLGGGVRSASDVRDARVAGFEGVLVATALQAGLISPDEAARLAS